MPLIQVDSFTAKWLKRREARLRAKRARRAEKKQRAEWIARNTKFGNDVENEMKKGEPWYNALYTAILMQEERDARKSPLSLRE